MPIAGADDSDEEIEVDQDENEAGDVQNEVEVAEEAVEAENEAEAEQARPVFGPLNENVPEINVFPPAGQGVSTIIYEKSLITIKRHIDICGQVWITLDNLNCDGDWHFVHSLLRTCIGQAPSIQLHIKT